MEPSLTDQRLQELAGEHGTPLYVHSLKALRGRIGELRQALAGCDAQLLFATMANDDARVLEAIAAQDVGACVNSVPHLQLALRCGFEAAKIQFTSTGIAADDMREIDRLSIRVNLDSVNQVRQWARLGLTKSVGLRVNVGSLIGLQEHDADRIGVSADAVQTIVAEAAQRGCRISGLHVYAGTNFTAVEPLLLRIEQFFQFAGQIEALEYVNIGGGIGIDYSRTSAGFDVRRWGSAIADMAKRWAPRMLVLAEPGRGLVGASGVFVTRVTDVKQLGSNTLVAVDGSVAVFPRPFHHPDNFHRVRSIRQGSDDERWMTVVGRTTFSKDILARCMLPASTDVGDLLVFDDAGAYCRSMASRFLGQPEPRHISID